MSVLSRDGPRGQPARRPARDRLGARHRRLPSPAQGRSRRRDPRAPGRRRAGGHGRRARRRSPRRHAQPLARGRAAPTKATTPPRSDARARAAVAPRRQGRGRRAPAPLAPASRRSARRSRRAPARARAAAPPAPTRASRARPRAPTTAPRQAEQAVEGVLEILANGSGFIRVGDADASDDDVYVSAAQVRRCELVTGDHVGGPVRAPAPLRALPLARPRRDDQRHRRRGGLRRHAVRRARRARSRATPFAFTAKDATLKQIADLAPIGRGSRVTRQSARPAPAARRRCACSAIELAAQEGVELQRRARRARARRSSPSGSPPS